MSGRIKNHFGAFTALLGAAVWATIATVAGLHRVRLGIIELLFLLAALVIVPLGLELRQAIEFPGERPTARLLPVFLLLAAIAVCASLWIPPGWAAASLGSLWMIVCLLLAWTRLVRRSRTPYSLISFALDVAQVDLILGACWFVVSRAGWRPMGFQEPIVLLTAVHFHYSGFATALIAAAAMSRAPSSKARGLRALVLLAVVLPFVVAMGFVISALLRFVAAATLAVVLTALAGVLFWRAGEFRSAAARTYLRSAACAAFIAFGLVLLYAIGDYFHRDWITIPGMANSHGVLNALGFVLLGLLGWLTELHAVATDNSRRGRTGLYGRRLHEERKPVQPAILPEFVAREFYDR